MFISSCKKLRIMKGSEARGLGCAVWFMMIACNLSWQPKRLTLQLGLSVKKYNLQIFWCFVAEQQRKVWHSVLYRTKENYIIMQRKAPVYFVDDHMYMSDLPTQLYIEGKQKRKEKRENFEFVISNIASILRESYLTFGTC